MLFHRSDRQRIGRTAECATLIERERASEKAHTCSTSLLPGRECLVACRNAGSVCTVCYTLSVILSVIHWLCIHWILLQTFSTEHAIRCSRIAPRSLAAQLHLPNTPTSAQAANTHRRVRSNTCALAAAAVLSTEKVKRENQPERLFTLHVHFARRFSVCLTSSFKQFA